MQQQISQYYEQNSPGQVQVIGVDLWNGTAGQMNSFKAQTGANYPLLLNGATATGGNVETLYGTYDNYVVISKQGIVRYHAALVWPHGNRYHLDEIRGSVDTLVAPTVGVGDPPAIASLTLSAAPNPTRGASTIALALPSSAPHADVAVLDLAGRRIATLWAGPAPAGALRLAWDGRDRAGEPVAAGVYRVVATVGSLLRERRLVVVR